MLRVVAYGHPDAHAAPNADDQILVLSQPVTKGSSVELALLFGDRHEGVSEPGMAVNRLRSCG